MKNKTLIGSVACGLLGVFSLIASIAVGVEKRGIKNGGAMLVQAGSKTMSRSEYLKQANSTVIWCVVVGVICLVLAVMLYQRFKKQNKGE